MELAFPSGFWLARACAVLRRGGVVAYPTEAVWGIGCDPFDREAVAALLRLKGREAGKGLILVAARFDQLAPWLAPLSAEAQARVFGTWPGPVTWLLPAAPHTPAWLTGGRSTLAVRIPDHPVVRALCERFAAPLVSTSANPSGRHPAVTPLAIRRYFGDRLDLLLPGALGGRTRPSEIRDISGRVVRAG